MKKRLAWGISSAVAIMILAVLARPRAIVPVSGLPTATKVPCESNLRSHGEQQSAFYFPIKPAVAIPKVISAFPNLGVSKRTLDSLMLTETIGVSRGSSTLGVSIPKVMVEPSDRAAKHCSNAPMLPTGGTFLIVHHPDNLVKQALASVGLKLP